MRVSVNKPLVACAIAASIVLAGGCAKQEKETDEKPRPEDEPAFCADTLLPPIGVESDILPVVETRIILPGDADDYLGGAAALYAEYHFVGLVAAKYRVREEPVSVEIAQFPTAEDAYGFYSRLRPLGVALGMIGAESYLLGNSLYFTSGQYVVTMSVEEITASSNQALALLAQEINKRIGPMRAPMLFVMFPWKGKISASNQYFAGDFLEGVGLEKVYTSCYELEGDTATFFLTMDRGGEQFLTLKEWAEDEAELVAAPEGLAFPEHSLAFVHQQRGLVVAGLVNHKLVGIINYRAASYESLVAGWIKGLR